MASRISSRILPLLKTQNLQQLTFYKAVKLLMILNNKNLWRTSEIVALATSKVGWLKQFNFALAGRIFLSQEFHDSVLTKMCLCFLGVNFHGLRV